MSRDRRGVTTTAGGFDAARARPRRGRKVLPRLRRPTEEMLDREAIRQLPIAHARFARSRDVKGMVGLYAKDAVIEVPTADPRLCIHGHHFEMLEGDRAEGSVYIELRAVGKELLTSRFRCYRDDYVKEEGVWKFQSRRLCTVSLPLPGMALI